MPVWTQVMKRWTSPSSQRSSNWTHSCPRQEVCSRVSFFQASFCMKSDDCERNGGGKCRGGCDVTYRVPWIEAEVRLQKLRGDDWTWNWFNFNKYIHACLKVRDQLKRQKNRRAYHQVCIGNQWRSCQFQRRKLCIKSGYKQPPGAPQSPVDEIFPELRNHRSKNQKQEKSC